MLDGSKTTAQDSGEVHPLTVSSVAFPLPRELRSELPIPFYTRASQTIGRDPFLVAKSNFGVAKQIGFANLKYKRFCKLLITKIKSRHSVNLFLLHF